MGGGQTKSAYNAEGQNLNNNNKDIKEENGAAAVRSVEQPKRSAGSAAGVARKEQSATVTFSSPHHNNDVFVPPRTVIEAAEQHDGTSRFLAERVIHLMPQRHGGQGQASSQSSSRTRPNQSHQQHQQRTQLYLSEVNEFMQSVEVEADDPPPIREMLRIVFRMWNTGNDGKLRQREVVNVFRELSSDKGLSEEYFDVLVKEMFGSHVFISFDEFYALITSNPLYRDLLDEMITST
eukprot:PhM_4_TR14115/c4_g1_i2/m.42975